MGQLIAPNSSLAAPGGGGTGTGTGFGTLRAAVALPAGATNNLNPGGGWPAGYGRLILTAAGVANVTGLVAGANGQPVFVFNNDPANQVTLNSQNAGSIAANQFAFVADLILSPGDGVFIMYDTPIARWLLT